MKKVVAVLLLLVLSTICDAKPPKKRTTTTADPTKEQSGFDMMLALAKAQKFQTKTGAIDAKVIEMSIKILASEINEAMKARKRCESETSECATKLAERIAQLVKAYSDMQLQQRYERCMQIFASSALCRKDHSAGGPPSFYLWARQMAKDIMDGRMTIDEDAQEHEKHA